MRTESDIKSAILKYLKYQRIFAWSNPRTGMPKKGGGLIPLGFSGVSDILGCLPDGRFLAIEVKRPENKLTEPQRWFINEVDRNRGVAMIAYDIDDVERTLKAAGYLIY